MEIASVIKPDQGNLYRTAFILSIFTIGYNLVEGVVSTIFGFEDESLTLFGFGVDSFIEVVSGIGIAQMIIRIQTRPESTREPFERTALRITGFAFYVLAGYLIIMSAFNVWTGHKPETTFWGVVISIVSILVMLALVRAKTTIGRQLKSEAILADASCTRVCIYMSLILLASSLIFETTGFLYIDSIGSLGLAYFSFQEGKECFVKAKTNKNCACGYDACN